MQAAERCCLEKQISESKPVGAGTILIRKPPPPDCADSLVHLPHLSRQKIKEVGQAWPYTYATQGSLGPLCPLETSAPWMVPASPHSSCGDAAVVARPPVLLLVSFHTGEYRLNQQPGQVFCHSRQLPLTGDFLAYFPVSHTQLYNNQWANIHSFYLS